MISLQDLIWWNNPHRKFLCFPTDKVNVISYRLVDRCEEFEQWMRDRDLLEGKWECFTSSIEKKGLFVQLTKDLDRILSRLIECKEPLPLYAIDNIESVPIFSRCNSKIRRRPCWKNKFSIIPIPYVASPNFDLFSFPIMCNSFKY